MIVLAFLAQTLRIAIPYLFAASGRRDLRAIGAHRARARGIHARRRVLRRARELLSAAVRGSVSLGAVAGGAVLALLYAVTAIRFRADQVVVGIAINLLVIGATRFFLRLAFHSSSNSPRVPGFGAEQSGTGFGALAANPLVWLGVLRRRVRCVAAVSNAVRTARARGGRASRGRDVGRRSRRPSSLSRRGAVGNAGGARRRVSRARPASVHRRDDGGPRLHRAGGDDLRRWDQFAPRLPAYSLRPPRRSRFSSRERRLIPSQFVEMIPYALTIVALAGVVGRAVPPAALGKAPAA